MGLPTATFGRAAGTAPRRQKLRGSPPKQLLAPLRGATNSVGLPPATFGRAAGTPPGRQELWGSPRGDPRGGWSIREASDWIARLTYRCEKCPPGKSCADPGGVARQPLTPPFFNSENFCRLPPKEGYPSSSPPEEGYPSAASRDLC